MATCRCEILEVGQGSGTGAWNLFEPVRRLLYQLVSGCDIKIFTLGGGDLTRQARQMQFGAGSQSEIWRESSPVSSPSQSPKSSLTERPRQSNSQP